MVLTFCPTYLSKISPINYVHTSNPTFTSGVRTKRQMLTSVRQIDYIQMHCYIRIEKAETPKNIISHTTYHPNIVIFRYFWGHVGYWMSGNPMPHQIKIAPKDIFEKATISKSQRHDCCCFEQSRFCHFPAILPRLHDIAQHPIQ